MHNILRCPECGQWQLVDRVRRKQEKGVWRCFYLNCFKWSAIQLWRIGEIPEGAGLVVNER